MQACACTGLSSEILTDEKGFPETGAILYVDVMMVRVLFCGIIVEGNKKPSQRRCYSEGLFHEEAERESKATS